jgi:hypothetical protein
MKAKLIKSWDFYKVSIKEGTEVNIIKGMEADADSVLNAPYGMCYLCELNGHMHYIPATLLTITDWANIDWEQRRYEIAKSAVQGFCSNSDKEICKESPFIKLAQWAVSAADALIAELKKGGAQ